MKYGFNQSSGFGGDVLYNLIDITKFRSRNKNWFRWFHWFLYRKAKHYHYKKGACKFANIFANNAMTTKSWEFGDFILSGCPAKELKIKYNISNMTHFY